MSKRIAVFIDGANIYATAKMLKVDINYAKVHRYFGNDLVRAYYYTAVKPRTGEVDNLRPLLDWLEYNHFKIVSKETKSFVDADGRSKIKGNMDMAIGVDAMEIARHVTDIWLFSGDGDFAYLVEALQRQGVRVTVVSSIKTTDRAGVVMPICADELRRTADRFVDLADLIAEFTGLDSKYA